LRTARESAYQQKGQGGQQLSSISGAGRHSAARWGVLPGSQVESSQQHDGSGGVWVQHGGRTTQQLGGDVGSRQQSAEPMSARAPAHTPPAATSASTAATSNHVPLVMRNLLSWRHTRADRTPTTHSAQVAHLIARHFPRRTGFSPGCAITHGYTVASTMLLPLRGSSGYPRPSAIAMGCSRPVSLAPPFSHSTRCPATNKSLGFAPDHHWIRRVVLPKENELRLVIPLRAVVPDFSQALAGHNA
jgi:hypothetical protein